jgi:hypothetical protein
VFPNACSENFVHYKLIDAWAFQYLLIHAAPILVNTVELVASTIRVIVPTVTPVKLAKMVSVIELLRVAVYSVYRLYRSFNISLSNN